jgi:uncharacterized protein (DUF427 family)
MIHEQAVNPPRRCSLNAKAMKLPGPDHPISIELSHSRVVVSVAKIEIANSKDALLLREASYPPVLYIPRKDADMSRLERSDHSTYCPYKGDCSYYSIPLGGSTSIDAVWTYERPYAAAAEIQGHLAFYRDRVDSIRITPDSSP